MQRKRAATANARLKTVDAHALPVIESRRSSSRDLPQVYALALVLKTGMEEMFPVPNRLAPIFISAALFLSQFLLMSCTSAQKLTAQDLSTDEAVIAEMQKRIDAKRASQGLDNKRSVKLNAHDVCIKRLEESQKIIIVGFFAYDRGCEFEGAFVDSRYFEVGDASLSKRALDVLGWGAANQARREQLAKLWVEKGLLAFFNVIEEKEKDLENRGFHPPQVASNAKGEITITLWIHLPSGMTPERGYERLEYRFAADGSLSGNSVLDNFSVR